jgi:hypothetical protein
MSLIGPTADIGNPLFQSCANCRWLRDDDVIAQTEFLQRQFPKHVEIADATLGKLDDFLGDNSCRRIITN